jgi:Fic family protein
MAIKAQEITREEVGFVLAKTRFYEVYGDQLNDRQARMVSRVFLEGRNGFGCGITTTSYEAMSRCPNRAGSRDLSDLVAKGMIIPLPAGGRVARYELAVVDPTELGFEKR